MRKAGAPEWQPLEQAVPLDLFRAEVEAWAQHVGVTPLRDSHPPDEAQVGQLLLAQSAHLRHRAAASTC